MKTMNEKVTMVTGQRQVSGWSRQKHLQKRVQP